MVSLPFHVADYIKSGTLFLARTRDRQHNYERKHQSAQWVCYHISHSYIVTLNWAVCLLSKTRCLIRPTLGSILVLFSLLHMTGQLSETVQKLAYWIYLTRWFSVWVIGRLSSYTNVPHEEGCPTVGHALFNFRIFISDEGFAQRVSVQDSAHSTLGHRFILVFWL